MKTIGKIGAWVVKLEAILAADAERPRKEQRTAQRLHKWIGARGFHRLVSDDATLRQGGA